MKKVNMGAWATALMLASVSAAVAQQADTTVHVRQYLQPDQPKKSDTATFSFSGACKGKVTIDLTSVPIDTFRDGYWDVDLQQWVEDEYESIDYAGFSFSYALDKLGGQLIGGDDYFSQYGIHHPQMSFQFESKNLLPLPGTTNKDKALFEFQYYPWALSGKLTEQVKNGARTLTVTQSGGINMGEKYAPTYLLAQTGIDCGGKSLEQYLIDNRGFAYLESLPFLDAKATAKVVINGLANDSYQELGKVTSASYSLKQAGTAVIVFPHKCTNKGDLGSEASTLTCSGVKPLKIKFALNAAGSMSIPQRQ